MLHSLTNLIIASNAETSLRQFTNMDDKVPDIAVIALLILLSEANAGEGSTLSLLISAVKVSSRVKFSKTFIILKQTSASKDCL